MEGLGRRHKHTPLSFTESKGGREEGKKIGGAAASATASETEEAED
jgi:hypothetical protein